jgi:hypothetical protein
VCPHPHPERRRDLARLGGHAGGQRDGGGQRAHALRLEPAQAGGDVDVAVRRELGPEESTLLYGLSYSFPYNPPHNKRISDEEEEMKKLGPARAPEVVRDVCAAAHRALCPYARGQPTADGLRTAGK